VSAITQETQTSRHRQLSQDERQCRSYLTLARQGWKKPGLKKKKKKKPAQWVFLVFMGFLGFFLYICPEERVFRVFSVSRNFLGAFRR
jgi:hypothetical protein